MRQYTILESRGFNLKILIVDDDKQIREGISQGIQWKEMGFDQVDCAANGNEAFELFKQSQHEIVITDIRMPGLDGLALFEKIREINKKAKVIILSGYSDFEYLKKAIQFSATDYELKPIKIDKLIALIKKMRIEIEEDQKKEEVMSKARASFQKGFFMNMLQGKIEDKQVISENLLADYQFGAKGSLICCVIQIDRIKVIENLKQDVGQKMRNQITRLVHQSLLPNYQGILHMDVKDIVLLLKTNNSELFHQNMLNEIRNFQMELSERLKQDIGYSVSIGISQRGNISEIKKIYFQAEEACSYGFYSGLDKVHIYDYSKNMSDDYESIIVTEKDILIKEIKNHDLAIVSKILEKLFLSIQEGRYFKKKNIENLCVELFELLSQSLREPEIQEIDVIKENIKVLREKPKFETINDYRDFVISNFENIMIKYKLADTKNYSVIVINAIKHVKSNYEKDITVEYLAHLVGKTPNYFSHIFKKEYGMSFVQFLNKVRIEKAKEYICYSDLRLYEIAERVGYKDYSYFTQVYKKVEGYPPANLRKGEES